MSRSTVSADKQLGAEVREIQKAAAVLACIQCTVEYENDVGADLADALAVVRAVFTAVAARIVTGGSKEQQSDR
jgi:hypothetical protein